MGRSGSSFGAAHFVSQPFWPHNTGMYVTDFHGNHPKYVYYLLKRIDFTRFNSGGAQPSLNRNFIASIEFAIPSLPEQTAIANALSDMDGLISGLERLIAKKRAIKEGAMQELLTGRVRLEGFDGEWETKRLGEVGIFKKGKGIRKDEVVPNGLPCVRYGELYTVHHEYIKAIHSFVSENTAQSSQEIKQGDLLLAGSGETAKEIGKCVAYLGDRKAYAGGDIIILTPHTTDSLFLGYYLNHAEVVKQKMELAQGDAVVHIYANGLKHIEIKIPSTNEQTSIAKILRDIDEEIAILEAKREKYLLIMKGMMEELLTGKTRLV